MNVKDSLREKKLLYKIKKDRDPEAYGELYSLYIERIYRFISFKVSSRSEAEDLTSDIFLKAWNYLAEGKYSDVRSFSGFIYKVAKTTLVDFYRKKGREQLCSLEDLKEQGTDAKEYEMIHDRYEAEKILKALKKMKREYQEIIILRYMDSLSGSEIAVILGKSRTNVRVTLHRALQVLKNILQKEQ
ncbi:MAG: RNA polymerase sigma factor [Candidatus Magasanikbacteria bacterium]|nr:RNA polymerase sigma factor [Candidatus Magasanikbacteria bacterium]